MHAGSQAENYRARVAGLHEALNAPDADRDAAETIRSLIEKIVLAPVDGKLAVDLYGDIGTILKLAMAKQGRNVPGLVSERLVLVAGACKRHKLLSRRQFGFGIAGLQPLSFRQITGQITGQSRLTDGPMNGGQVIQLNANIRSALT